MLYANIWSLRCCRSVATESAEKLRYAALEVVSRCAFVFQELRYKLRASRHRLGVCVLCRLNKSRLHSSEKNAHSFTTIRISVAHRRSARHSHATRNDVTKFAYRTSPSPVTPVRRQNIKSDSITKTPAPHKHTHTIFVWRARARSVYLRFATTRATTQRLRCVNARDTAAHLTRDLCAGAIKS